MRGFLFDHHIKILADQICQLDATKLSSRSEGKGPCESDIKDFCFRQDRETRLSGIGGAGPAQRKGESMR